MSTIKVTVWGEGSHENNEAAHRIYPLGIHQAVADALNESTDIRAVTAVLEQPEHGLAEALLAETEVLVWWGHRAHSAVQDHIVERVKCRVLQGMGLIALHSSHMSKIFRALMGTSCTLRWRVAGEMERVWVCQPGHPIADGLDAYFEIPQEEMYGEPFDIPSPDDQIFLSWFDGGEVHRSGCTWRRGSGKIFYFGPGHETYPTYYQQEIKRILANAVRWAKSDGKPRVISCPKVLLEQSPESLRAIRAAREGQLA